MTCMVNPFRPNVPTSKGKQNTKHKFNYYYALLIEQLNFSIINALGMKTWSTTDDKQAPTAQINVNDLNLETPLSSLNVSPEHVCKL